MQAENTFAMGAKFFACPHGSQEILNQASKRLNINSHQIQTLPTWHQNKMTSFLRRHQLKLKANAYNGYLRLLSSYEKLVFQPRSIKCLREGIELYTSPAKPPNKISEKALEISKKKFSLVMKLYGFSESHQLPESPSEKNKIWKEQIQPRLKMPSS